MKLYRTLALLAGLTLCTPPNYAAETGSDPKAQLDAVVEKIRDKLQDGEATEAALADEIKQLDALLKESASADREETAQILFMKATLYLQVFNDPKKALEQFDAFMQTYPNASANLLAQVLVMKASMHIQMLDDAESGLPLLEQVTQKYADTPSADLAKQLIRTARMQAQLTIGKPFPDFDEKDLDDKPLSLARFKGKVVLIDFWATWCGPCVGELPNVLAAYEQYHDQGFEIIGISLDQDRDKLTAFLKQKKMTWPQYFDGGGWQTKLAQNYGINSIPATFLVDTQGVIIGKDLRGPALAAAVGKALEK